MNYDQLEKKIQGLNIVHFNSLIRAYKNGIGIAVTFNDDIQLGYRKIKVYHDFLHQILAYIMTCPDSPKRQALIAILEEELALDKLNRLSDIKLKLEKAKALKPQSSTAKVLCVTRKIKLNYTVRFADPVSEKPIAGAHAEPKPVKKSTTHPSKKQYSLIDLIKNFFKFFEKDKSRTAPSFMVPLQPLA